MHPFFKLPDLSLKGVLSVVEINQGTGRVDWSPQAKMML
jgi:hypothetical protein